MFCARGVVPAHAGHLLQRRRVCQGPLLVDIGGGRDGRGHDCRQGHGWRQGQQNRQEMRLGMKVLRLQVYLFQCS